MKLASFSTASGPSYGAVVGDGVVDLGRRLGSRFPDLKVAIDRVGVLANRVEQE